MYFTKSLISLLFILTAPLFIFFSTILYMPNASNVLKITLARAGVYQEISENIAKLKNDSNEWQQVYEYLSSTFTPGYIKTKTEKAIDDASGWMRGATTVPPVISFADIKEDLITNNQQVYYTMQQQLLQESDDASRQNTGNDPSLIRQKVQTLQTIHEIQSFLQSDFIIRIDGYLIGLKQSYRLVRILQPSLLALLFVYILLLCILNKTWTSRFVWIATTFLLTGIGGFLLVYEERILISSLVAIILDNAGQIVQLLSPLIVIIVRLYVANYAYAQSIASLLCVICAILLYIAALSTKTLGPILGIKKAEKKYPLPQTIKMPKSNPFTHRSD